MHTSHYANDPASMSRSRKSNILPDPKEPLSFYRNTGTEGSRWDPTGYEELVVEFRGHRVVLHSGLGVKLMVDGVEFKPLLRRKGDGEKEEFEQIMAEFVRILGFTPTQLERWDRKSKERCRCGSKNFKAASGYPGESFVICAECNCVIDSDFNESAII